MSAIVIMAISGLLIAVDGTGILHTTVGVALLVPIMGAMVIATIVIAGGSIKRAEAGRSEAQRNLTTEHGPSSQGTRRVHILEITRAVTQVIHSSLDVDESLPRAVERLGAGFSADRALAQIDATEGIARAVSAWSAPGVPPIPPQRLLGLLVGAPVPLVIGDVTRDRSLTADQREMLEAAGVRSLLACAVTARGERLGSVVLANTTQRDWPDLEVSALGLIGREFGVGIANARAFELQGELLLRADELKMIRGDFISKVSHELRSPLTSVLGYVELLGEELPGALTPEQRRMLAIVDRNGHRLLSLVEDLLTLSRIESGKQYSEFALVPLTPILDRVIDTIRPLLVSSQRECTLTVEPGIELDADIEQIERAITNLVSNAVKFTAADGHIAIVARSEYDQVVISVSDDGIGIPEAEQHLLFTRFFRSSISHQDQTQGTGLGLFILKQIVDAHGGTVDAVSAEGHGATFTVRLPFVQAATEASTNIEEVVEEVKT